jgi:hypothetical protein
MFRCSCKSCPTILTRYTCAKIRGRTKDVDDRLAARARRADAMHMQQDPSTNTR